MNPKTPNPMKKILTLLALLFNALTALSQLYSPGLRQEAEDGNPEAQFTLGLCYDIGDGVVENKRESTEWYRKAEAQNNGYAMNNLGLMYIQGKGVRENIPIGMYWLKKAGELGEETAIDNYNRLYEAGYRAASSPNGTTATSGKRKSRRR